MAEIPVDPLRIIERFGPHLSAMTGVRLSTSVEPDRLVKTHCCFCGQQCGIQLKVRDNEVIGFEPWEDFPFNRGMLCPKGVKRYLQGSHPDRLTTALRRDTSSASGIQPAAVRRGHQPRRRRDRAHSADPRRRRLRRPRRRQPDDREDLSARQVRARVPEDAVHRLQRPAVHGQRRRREQEGVRHRPHDQPVVRHGRHRGDLGRGLERRRVLADHDQLHLAGARAGREDHRPGSAHHAGRADLRPVPAGEAGARRGAVRRRAADHDRARLARSRVHRRAHGRLRAGRRVLPRVDAGADRGGDRRAAACADAGGRVVGHGEDELPLSRPRHRAPLERRAELARHDQPRARVGPDRQAEERLRHHRRPGQRPGRPRARAEVRSAPRLARHQQPRAPPLHRRRLGHRRAGAARARASTPTSCSARSIAARSRGCCRSASTRRCRCPTTPSSRAASRSSSSTPPSTSSSTTPRWHADVVLPGSLHEEDEGTVTQVEGRIIKINKAVDCPGEAREDWRIIQDIAQALGRPHGFTFTRAARDLRRAARRQQRRRRRLLRRHLREDRRSSWASSGRATARTRAPAPRSTTIPARRGCSSAAATTRSPRAADRSTSPTAGRASTSPTIAPPVDDASDEYPIFLTTGRVVSQFLSGTQTRRIGPLVKQYPEPRIEMHPRLAAKLGIADGDWATAETRRGTITLKAQVVTTIRPDTIFIPYHWAGPEEREPADRGRAGSDQQDPAVQGVRVPRAQGGRRRRTTRRCSSRSNRRAGPSHGQTGLPALLHRSEPLHRLPGVRAGVHRVRHASRRVDDSPRVRRTGPRACRPCRWSACTASSRPARRCVRPTPSSAPATAWCSRRASRAASPAATAWSPARSACPSSTKTARS